MPLHLGRSRRGALPPRLTCTSFMALITKLALAQLVLAQDYQLPEPTFQAYSPKGFRVSIPDDDGVQLFAFHGNVNRPLYNVEAGDMSVDITRKTNGRWEYYNPQKRLKVGDVINYWIYVQRDGIGYQRLDQTHWVRELIPTATSAASSNPFSAQRPGGSSQSLGQAGGDLEYRPPSSPTESRPSTNLETRPQVVPDEEYRPRPPALSPLDLSQPSAAYESRPPQLFGSRPPVAGVPLMPAAVDHRPSTSNGEHYGARPPPPPAQNHEYPPPPPPNQAATVVHNHHVGFVGSEDRYPTSAVNNNNNFNSGDPYPTSSSSNNNNFNSGDRYPPVSSSSNNYNSDRYPNTNSNNNNNNYNQAGSGALLTGGSSLGGQGGQAGQAVWGAAAPGPASAGLPLTGDKFTAQTPLSVETGCDLSVTYVNGRPACKGQVVFEEDWKTLNLRRWSHEVKISGSPDFEFCIYAQHPENAYVKSGLLHLKPTLTNDKYGADFVRKGKLQLSDCTAGPANSDSCAREAMFSYILPPVVASRLNTKNSFSFKYGKIDVRARLPRGDWIYPEVWLQPLREEYGPGLASGRIHVAFARGNRQLRGPEPESEDLSGRTLVVGALAGGRNVGSAAARRKFYTKTTDHAMWTEQFHNYSLLWTPETLAFSVDGVEIGAARPEEFGGLLHGRAEEGDDPWAQGSRIAPFDKEFYISLGLAVGGIHAFPDGCRSGTHEKPWKNTGAKAMLSFWNAKDSWYPTWNSQSEMLVESVRVTALNN